MKKIIALLLALVMVFSLAACAAEKEAPVEEEIAEEVVEETEAPAEVEETEEAPEAEWIALDAEAGILTLTLPEVAESGYGWNMDFSDPAVAEMLTCTNETGDFTASFRGLEDGECTITLTYACGEAQAYAYAVEAAVAGGKITEILSHSYEELDGVQEVTVRPELTALRSENDMEAILAEHTSVTAVTEAWSLENGEEVYSYKNVEQYWFTEDGRLFQSMYQTDANDEFSYCGEFHLGEGIPAALYAYDAVDGSKTLMMVAPDEYESIIYGRWLPHTIDLDEELVSTSVEEDLNNETLIVRYSSEGTPVCEIAYFTELDSGLITGMETRYYDLESGEENMVTRTNVLYDQPREMEHAGVQNVITDENYCLLTMVFAPGTDRETNFVYQVSQDANAFFYTEENYGAYEDAECTVTKEYMDLMQDEEIFYVCAAE